MVPTIGLVYETMQGISLIAFAGEGVMVGEVEFIDVLDQKGVIIFKVYSGLTLSKCGRASIKSSLAKLSLVAQT